MTFAKQIQLTSFFSKVHEALRGFCFLIFIMTDATYLTYE